MRYWCAIAPVAFVLVTAVLICLGLLFSSCASRQVQSPHKHDVAQAVVDSQQYHLKQR